MSSAIIAYDLSYELPTGRLLFNNLNFTLGTHITALVGPNGVGKTTLAKLILQEFAPSTGSVRNTAQINYLSQRQERPLCSVEEFLGYDREWSALREQLLESINQETSCTVLSGGEWMRVRLAQAIDQKFLILDEPTNDLDRTARKHLLNFLRHHKSGALLISHDRECLGVCTSFLELSNKGLLKFTGSWSDYLVYKNNERRKLKEHLDLSTRLREQAVEERQQKIDQQEKRNRLGQKAADRGGMPKILIGARKRKAQKTTAKVDVNTLEHLNLAVSEAVQSYNEQKIDPVMYADLLSLKIPNQKLVAEAIDFNILFEAQLYLENLNFTWRGPIRMAIKGSNGAGKSSLIKAILGQRYKTHGQLKKGDLKTLYIDQSCSQLNENISVFENVKEFTALDDTDVRNGLAKFLFFKDSVFQLVKDLSGGERLRALLACGFLNTHKPELLVLDEPTNNLDLSNIEFLENLIAEYQGALIAISHDDVFLKNCNITQEFLLQPK